MRDSKIWKALQNQACVQVNMLQGPTISVIDITVGGIDCGVGGPCPNNLICTNDGCLPADMVPVVITFTNSGDIDGSITPTLSVGGVGTGITPTEGMTITVPAGGSAMATFAGVTLVRGSNNICIDWT